MGNIDDFSSVDWGEDGGEFLDESMQSSTHRSGRNPSPPVRNRSSQSQAATPSPKLPGIREQLRIIRDAAAHGEIIDFDDNQVRLEPPPCHRAPRPLPPPVVAANIRNEEYNHEEALKTALGSDCEDDSDEESVSNEPSRSPSPSASGDENQEYKVEDDPEFAIADEDEMEDEEEDIPARRGSSEGNRSPRGSRHRRRAIRDDNSNENFFKRYNSLPVDDEDYTITRNVESESGLSSLPWKVDTKSWNRLFPFQKDGVQWLQTKMDHRSGGILADEMGLGKTIQTCIFLRSIAETQRTSYKYKGLDTCLIVCPVSVTHQWVEKLNEWFPRVRVFLLHQTSSTGRERNWADRILKKLGKKSRYYPDGAVVLTTYGTFTNLHKRIVPLPWQVVILDEGHHIRNDDTKCAEAMRQLTTTQRFILTGTPFQNRLKEFWKLIDFVNPGRLSDAKTFDKCFIRIINAGAYINCSPEAAAKAYQCLMALHCAIKPLILRRLQKDHRMELNLTDIEEVMISCELSPRQRRIYQEFCGSIEVQQILERNIKAFGGINKLGDICNHPGIYRKMKPGTEKFGRMHDSGKVVMLFRLFRRWFKNPNNRVVLFTQRLAVVDMLAFYLDKKQIAYCTLTGNNSLPERTRIIKRFEEDLSIKVFLMTTRTGGLGLNLASANKAVIFDPDWNPQADNQAKMRIYRMGQQHKVTIVRLVSNGSIEDRKYFKQIQKENLAEQLLNNADVNHTIPNNTLKDLFTLKPAGLKGSDIGVYIEGDIVPEEGLKSSNKDLKKKAKKDLKHKLEGFEDKKLLLSLFDDDKLVAMRNHARTVQDGACLRAPERKRINEAVESAVKSLLHSEGRLAHGWKKEFHRHLRHSGLKRIKSEYNVEEEKIDGSFWDSITPRFKCNDDKKELDKIVMCARLLHDFLQKCPDGKEEKFLKKILAKQLDFTDPTQTFFFREIISTIAIYNEDTDCWTLKKMYQEARIKRKDAVNTSEDHSPPRSKKHRRSMEDSSNQPSTSTQAYQTDN
ncbi:Protein CBR-CSB-1 [Caenorhabditis briggsae]|uniref:DNA repair and recombination protein RAD54-like n=1 Tax=Caenorhabditis briggsae TaxID=6238 RepID=A8XNA8_CAEBR|nr:Protein CBR-CSB-1 [Caenorhabditis briggsae]CAP34339.1 Protein CBR-CSB-1 [Caenorhabditis briggsae]